MLTACRELLAYELAHALQDSIAVIICEGGRIYRTGLNRHREMSTLANVG